MQAETQPTTQPNSSSSIGARRRRGWHFRSQLAKTPAAAMYTVPALSINAVEITDGGDTSAWTYGDAQHMASQGPVVLATAASDAGPTTFKVPFSSLGGGSPIATLDPSTIITVQWQLNAKSGGPGCSANFTVANVAFY